MAYFQNFNLIPYDITGELPRKSKIVTNILSRAKMLDSIKDNTFVYYLYDVLDGDTPEIIAAKYYDNPNRHWMILLANDINDPVYDWPLTSDNFANMIITKYGSISNAKSTTHHYEKVITKTDSVTSTITVKRIEIDVDTYNSLSANDTQTINLVDGNSVTIVTTKNAISNYDYELDLNESKRKIRIIDKTYVDRIESELRALLLTNV